MVKAKKNQAQNKKRRNGKSSKTINRRMQGDNDPALKWARLISDPCYGQLTHPLYGGTSGGYLARFKSTITVHLAAAQNNGWFLWFPEYHCAAGASTANALAAPQSCWIYENSGVSTFPPNTTAAPLGSPASLMVPVADPANSFLRGVAGTARTVAACAKVMYAGAPLTKSGIFTYDNQVKASQVLDTPTTGVPDIGQLAAVSSTTSPTPRTMEVRWIPNIVNSARYRRATPLTTDFSQNMYHDDTILFSRFPTGTSLSTPGSSNSDSTGILITWRGLPPTVASDVTIELYKVVEWMPYDNGSLIQPTPAPPTQSSVNRAFDMIASMAKAISYAGDVSDSLTSSVYSINKLVRAGRKVAQIMN